MLSVQQSSLTTSPKTTPDTPTNIASTPPSAPQTAPQQYAFRPQQKYFSPPLIDVPPPVPIPTVPATRKQRYSPRDAPSGLQQRRDNGLLAWLNGARDANKSKESDKGREKEERKGGSFGNGNVLPTNGICRLDKPSPSRLPLPIPRHPTSSPRSPSNITLQPITPTNIHYLRQINSAVFPVHYNDKFYKDILTLHSPSLSALAFLNTTPIGAICCRREPVYESSDPRFLTDRARIYIMTLGILSPYRRLHVGSALLERIVENVAGDLFVAELALHVQTTNREALRFYERNGFVKVVEVPGYYSKNKGVEPPDAWFLKRDLGRRFESGCDDDGDTGVR